jgi:DNA repair exonuclease SbcCD ATPase subunit
MSTTTDTLDSVDALRQRIADLERELRLKDERIRDLRDEVDQARDLVRRFEEQAWEHAEYLETFTTAFGMEVDDQNCWRWGQLITNYDSMIDDLTDLRQRYNALVSEFNRYAVAPQPVGRPIAASEAQQALILKHHKAGRSSRWIAEEMTLSRRTVSTVIGKVDGTDRTSNKHRKRFGLEPKRKDWRQDAIKRLPKRVTAHFEKGRELAREAKGLK